MRIYVLEQTVVLDGGRLHVAGDQDGDDEGVDGDDTGHDDGDQTLEIRERWSAGWKEESEIKAMGLAHLHDQVWPECSYTRDTDARFGCAVRGSCAPEYHGRCDPALHS